eukprot:Phypoly_transcript_08224.p1 GENE.Phypoly_transcript_08224~~Phypoly_transcript_08224.p1  ORF type:complete len:386 (+),score=43.45 Phypoly_transcript_08224:329-1486(+)
MPPTSENHVTSIFFHKNRVVLVYHSGKIDILQIPNTTGTPVKMTLFSVCEPASCQSVEVTEDSRVFMCTNNGMCFALDFSNSTPLTQCADASQSFHINNLITMGLQDVASLFKLLIYADKKSDLQKAMDKYETIKNTYMPPRCENARVCSAVGSALEPVKAIAFLWENVKFINKSTSFTTSLVSTLLTSLRQSVMDPSIFPNFPLYKELAELQSDQNKTEKTKQLTNWIKMAKKFPERITLARVYEQKEKAQDELTEPHELTTYIADLDEIETKMVTKIVSDLLEIVESSAINVATAPGKLQKEIFEYLGSLITCQDFEKIKPLVQDSILDFLNQIKDFGGLSSTNQDLLLECMDFLKNQSTPKFETEIEPLVWKFRASCLACHQ